MQTQTLSAILLGLALAAPPSHAFFFCFNFGGGSNSRNHYRTAPPPPPIDPLAQRRTWQYMQHRAAPPGYRPNPYGVRAPRPYPYYPGL